jgi:glutamine cyclotransferase
VVILGTERGLFLDVLFIKCLAFLHWLFNPVFIIINKILGWTRINWLILDLAILPFTILSLPTYLMGERGTDIRRKMNAYSHIHFVCKSCPKARRNQRDPDGGEICLWNMNWMEGNYQIPGNFGIDNWKRQYLFKPTKLEKYAKFSLPVVEGNISKIKKKKSWLFVGSSMMIWFVIILLIIAGSRVEYLYKGAEVGSAEMWENLGDVPEVDNAYPPQGMTYWNEMLIFSNHWQDEKSQIYLLNPENMSVLSEFEMPAEAIHTSGLTFDGSWLWAVDYRSNYIYKISINESFNTGTAIIEEKYDTGLKGSSAIAFIDYGAGFLAISDFMHTGKTYLIQVMDVDLLIDGVGVSEIATHSYHHGWFSQGLTWDGEYLFETVNNLGIDRVEVLEIKSWIDGVSSKPCSVTSFAFAGYAGEDLANDGYSMWSSDESSYKFYKLENYRAILPSESPCYSIV